MDQITYYSTFLKEILDANPWIWHVIQIYMLFIFLGSRLIRKTTLFGKVILPFKFLNFLLIVIILFLHAKIVSWGLIIFLFIIISNIIRLFKINKK